MLQAFDPTFQVQAIDENMKIQLFDVDSSVLQEESIEKEDNIDTNESIEKIMENSLAKVAEIATSNRSSSISTLKRKSRKRYVHATQTMKFH